MNFLTTFARILSEETGLPADKIAHFCVGFAVAAFSFICAFSAVVFGLMPATALPFIVAFGPTVAGITKEFADWQDNEQVAALGQPPMHGVEAMDAFATMLPGWIAGVVLFLVPHWL